MLKNIQKTMNEVKQYPVLKHIVNIIHQAIGDSKVEEQSESIAIIKDGNDSIQIRQISDDTEQIATIFITDNKEILFSEDLLETLENIHKSTSDRNLKEVLLSTKIIVNDLSLETGFIFQEVRAAFDELSDSYEFVKTIAKNIDDFAAKYKFGDNKFDIIVTNTPESIRLDAQIDSAVKPAVKKTIEADTDKIEKALNNTFK